MSGYRQRNAPEGTKWCPGCKEYKPIDEFYKSTGTNDGLQYKCKPCQLARWRKNYHAKKAQRSTE